MFTLPLAFIILFANKFIHPFNSEAMAVTHKENLKKLRAESTQVKVSAEAWIASYAWKGGNYAQILTTSLFRGLWWAQLHMEKNN